MAAGILNLLLLYLRDFDFFINWDSSLQILNSYIYIINYFLLIIFRRLLIKPNLLSVLFCSGLTNGSLLMILSYYLFRGDLHDIFLNFLLKSFIIKLPFIINKLVNQL